MPRSDDDDYTRAEVAKILGCPTKEGVRALERTGRLRPPIDASGVVRYELAQVEQVRVEREAKGKRVMSAEQVPQMVRKRPRLPRTAGQWLRGPEANRDWQKERVENRNDQRQAEFKRDHLDLFATCDVLGIPFGTRELDRLCREGVLRKVEPPSMLRLDGGFSEEEPFLVVEDGPSPLAVVGPYFIREEVLRLREERLRASPAVEPVAPPTAPPMRVPPDVVAVALEVLQKLAKGS